MAEYISLRSPFSCVGQQPGTPIVKSRFIAVKNLVILLKVSEEEILSLGLHVTQECHGRGRGVKLDLPCIDVVEHGETLMLNAGWTEDKVARGLEVLVEQLGKIKKRTVAAPKQGKAKKTNVASEVKVVMDSYLERVQDLIGTRALDDFRASAEYKTQCDEAVALRVAERDAQLKADLEQRRVDLVRQLDADMETKRLEAERDMVRDLEVKRARLERAIMGLE